jgi:hypothetical protein
MPAPGAEYATDFAGSAEAARRAVERAAQHWGAELAPVEAGATADLNLVLPVVAGLRRGIARARLSVLPAEGRCRLILRVDEVDLRVQRPAVVVLAIAAAGGVAAFLWPFVPGILPLVPLALVLAVAGWLLVVARLHSSGPEEFLAAVERQRGEPERELGLGG